MCIRDRSSLSCVHPYRNLGKVAQAFLEAESRPIKSLENHFVFPPLLGDSIRQVLQGTRFGHLHSEKRTVQLMLAVLEIRDLAETDRALRGIALAVARETNIIMKIKLLLWIVFFVICFLTSEIEAKKS